MGILRVPKICQHLIIFIRACFACNPDRIGIYGMAGPALFLVSGIYPDYLRKRLNL